MDKRETLKKLFLENGLEKEDVFKSPQGYVIITRSGIEKIQYKNKIEISFTSSGSGVDLTPFFSNSFAISSFFFCMS